jgi:ubiquinone/menaquinone biosynthesis C-methylase UbiE
MNQDHLELCSSEQWREALRELIIPFAFDNATLGEDVLEVGPGPGLTTDLLRERVRKLTAVELDQDLALKLAMRLADTNVEVVNADATALPFDSGRFTAAVSLTMLHHIPTVQLQDQMFDEIARVLRPGGVFIAADSLASLELAEFHHDDTYNPVDPDTLPARLTHSGFSDIEVRSNGHGWAVHAHSPGRSG